MKHVLKARSLALEKLSLEFCLSLLAGLRTTESYGELQQGLNIWLIMTYISTSTGSPVESRSCTCITPISVRSTPQFTTLCLQNEQASQATLDTFTKCYSSAFLQRFYSVIWKLFKIQPIWLHNFISCLYFSISFLNKFSNQKVYFRTTSFFRSQ